MYSSGSAGPRKKEQRRKSWGFASLRKWRGPTAAEQAVARLSQACSDGNTEAVLSILRQHPEAIDARADSRTQKSALHLAAASGRVAVVKALLKFGASLATLDAGGYSAGQFTRFSIACYGRHRRPAVSL